MDNSKEKNKQNLINLFCDGKKGSMWLTYGVLFIEYVLLAWLVIHTGYRVYMFDEIDKFRDEWRSGEPREFKVLSVKNVITKDHESTKQVSHLQDIETGQEIDIKLGKWDTKELVSIGKTVNIEFDKEDLYDEIDVLGYAKKGEIIWVFIGGLIAMIILSCVELGDSEIDKYHYKESSKYEALKKARDTVRTLYFTVPFFTWLACTVISLGIAFQVANN